MIKRLGLSLTLVLIFSAFSAPAFAVPFSFEYNDTILSTSITGLGLSAGQAVKITMTLDNGNLTNLAQTWNATHLQSVTFDFNNGGLVTTFNAPFDGGLGFTTGNFMTDGTGALTSSPTDWGDAQATTDFTTTGSGALLSWNLNGGNPVYFEFPPGGLGASSRVSLTNVTGNTSADNWSPAASTVPEPSTMLLFGTGVLGLMGYSWRRKHQEVKA